MQSCYHSIFWGQHWVVELRVAVEVLDVLTAVEPEDASHMKGNVEVVDVKE